MDKRAVGGVVLACLLVMGSPAPGAPAKRVKRLLPDLTPLPPREIMGPSTGFEVPLGVDAPLVVNGCFVDEHVRKGARRCLRFDGIVGNSGKGALELGYGASGSEVAAYQRIFYSDGSYKDRFATISEPHPTHLHFHVQDFYLARLWGSTSAGGRMGTEPVATGDKNGFCPEDSEPLGDETVADRKYSCFTEDERSDSSALQVVGISAGWMDIYRYGLPDQYVEISGVEDGYYALELELDPNNVFIESNETNNIVCVVLRLEGTTAELTPSLSC